MAGCESNSDVENEEFKYVQKIFPIDERNKAAFPY